MSHKLIKCLLDRKFYDTYRHKLSVDLFPPNDNTIRGIWWTLEKAYETIQDDLTVDSLRELHYTYNPALTDANRRILNELFDDLKKLDITKESSEIIIKKALEQHYWNQLANICINGADGLTADFLKAQEILDGIREGISLHKDVKIVTGTIKEMLAATSQQQKWKFHLPTLQKRLSGIGPATFTLLAARPNAGKTAFMSAIIAQPGGFLDQGAKVVYIGNEEAAVRTRLRMASSYTGLSREQLEAECDETDEFVADTWGKVKENLQVLDLAGYSIEELQKYLKERREPTDILVIDQLDKLTITGEYGNESDRLRKLYTSTRELLKRHNIAGMGVCQASVDAENKAIFGADCLENSKTGKFAETDVILCLGKHLEEGAEENPKRANRTLNFPKNKLSGWEGHFGLMMDFTTSRMMA